MVATLLISVSVTLPMVGVKAGEHADWAQPRYDSSLSAYNAEEQTLSPHRIRDIEPTHVFDLGRPTGPPLVAGGDLLTMVDGDLTRISLDGTLRWTRTVCGDTGPRGDPGLTLIGDTLAYWDHSGSCIEPYAMNAVDAATGEHRWADDELLSAAGSDVLIGRRLVHDDETGDANLSTVGVDPVTGSFLWDTRDADIGPIHDGVAYLTIYGVLRRIDPMTGNATLPPIRHRNLDRAIALADDHLYLGLEAPGKRSSVASVDPESGALEWRVPVPALHHLSLSAGGGTVVLSRGDSRLHPAFTVAIDADNGEARWASDLVGSAHVVGSGGVFFLRGRSGEGTVAVRGTDGAILRRLPGVHRVVIADGVVVATKDDTIEIWA